MPHIRELFDLTGRVALVTGGSRGLGREIAEGLAEAGATTIITARREQWLGPAEAELRAAGLAVSARPCDVTDEAAVEALVAGIVAEHGALDIVVNNAGISRGAPAEEMAVEQFRRVVDTNATGSFLVAQSAARRMIPRGRGTIVNTASVAGLYGSPPDVLRAAGYSASKGAVIALTRALAIDHVADHIRVNAVCPGTVDSPWVRRLVENAGESLDALRARQPMGRLGTPDEIAEAVLYLASEASAFTTGSALVIDGGLTAA